MSRLVAGVVGNPVGHSLSPLIHNAWIEAAGIDAVYERRLAPRDGFAAAVQDLQDRGLRGVNVTVPFKEEALALADEASDIAVAAGAANLLLFRADGAVEASNTDGMGLITALRRQAPHLRPATRPVLILGAGGAARGAIAALLDAGVGRIQILNRTFEKAEALAKAVDGPVEAVSDAGRAFADNDLIINASSALLTAGRETYPLERCRPGTVVMHMTYRPLHPPFLKEAAALGLTIVDGLEMLIGQAIPSFEALFGQPPDLSVDVRRLALAALEEGT